MRRTWSSSTETRGTTSTPRWWPRWPAGAGCTTRLRGILEAMQMLSVDAFMDEYIRRYSERDVEGATELCRAPFVAIREGAPIDMADRDAVRDHFAAMIDTYRGSGVATWRRIESDTRELGEHSVFTTVRWNALDANGNVLRDTRTTYP